MRKGLQPAGTARGSRRTRWLALGALVAVGAFAVAVGALSATAAPSATTLKIESWRSDDLAIWKDKIIPAFEKANPDIKVEFAPTAPTEYNAALETRLKGGTAGDLITCRPFDASLALYKSGYLAKLNGLPGLQNFGSVAKSAWITDNGKDTFCVPMASVIHGFIYNKDAFKKAGVVGVPKTEAQFLAALEKIKAEGSYAPLALGTHDLWEAATMGYQNIGPNRWKGEAGRLGLIKGSAKLTDKAHVDTFKALAQWGPYLPKGASSVTYPDAQNLFTSGRAAIYPAGSWEIAGFDAKAKFPMGAFLPPQPAGQKTCYFSDHTDIALGLNAKSQNTAAARTFLSWVASPAFAKLYQGALPGFFSLQNKVVPEKNPLARTFVSWRKQCKPTIRNSYQILSRGTPNLENELWATSAAVLNGTMTPEAATKRLQKGLARWYPPQKKNK